MPRPAEDPNGLAARLGALYHQLRRLPGLAPLGRVAVAHYDERQDLLCSFAHCGETDDPLETYETRLTDVPSLAILAGGDSPRVVDDLSIYGNNATPHTLAIRGAGFRSSLTFPIRNGATLLGFVFFNATIPAFFTPAIVATLAPFTTAIVAMAAREIESAATYES